MLLLGILNVVIVAVLASLLLIRRTAHPHVALLGRIPGTRMHSDMERNPDNQPTAGVLAFRVDASLRWLVSGGRIRPAR